MLVVVVVLLLLSLAAAALMFVVVDGGWLMIIVFNGGWFNRFVFTSLTEKGAVVWSAKHGELRRLPFPSYQQSYLLNIVCVNCVCMSMCGCVVCMCE